MAHVKLPWAILLLLCSPYLAPAQVDGCLCDPADAASLEPRQCSLSREVLANRSKEPVFFIKDSNPRKPNRWLAMPPVVHRGVSSLAQLSPKERTALWTGAISKAAELWGGEWGLAYNGDLARSQCHPHIHIGKLIQGVETPRFMVVDSPEDIPAPAHGEGLWVRPQGNRLQVFLGEQLTESVILR
jgi:hypothetical protein